MDKDEIKKILALDLFKELGLANIEPEVKQTILDDASYIVTRGTWIRVMDSLTDEKQIEISKMLADEPENTDRIAEFIKKEVPNYEDLVKEEVATYKSLLLAKQK